ncbi:MAG: hypothetical protein H7A20_04815 [Rhodanobacteraceae bacterium]|nr:hypothetical protein [Rhodanobacteraceae bacterium]
MPDADLMETVEKPSRMQRFQDWLAVIANLSVPGRHHVQNNELQNTTAIEAQTRDSIADKQMNYYGMLATNPELASVVVTATSQGMDSLDPVQQRMWIGLPRWYSPNGRTPSTKMATCFPPTSSMAASPTCAR